MSQISYPLWVFSLAAALWWPASRIILVLSVRRLERRLGRILDRTEIAGQKRRAWVLGLFLSLVFSALFNLRMLGGGPGVGG